MKISIKNDLSMETEKTYLSNAVAAGVTTSPSVNTTGFTTQYAIQIGETTQERTEVVIGTVASGTSFTHPALAFSHPADTPIYNIKFDQVIFEKSTSGTAGTATPIASGTISYRPDDVNFLTSFDDATGATTDAYRTRFRNSVLGSNTSQSDWVTPAGYSFYSLAAIRERVRSELWDSTFLQDDNRLNNWINELKDSWTNTVISVNEDYALGTTNVAFGTAGYGTITTADYVDVRRLWVTYDGINSYKSTKQSVNDPIPSEVFSSVFPQHRWFGNTVFQVSPAGAGGTAQLVFYRFGTTLVNDTDELPHPFRSYTDAFVAYGVAKANFLDQKPDMYDRKMGDVKTIKADFLSNIIPRDRSGVQYMDITDPTSGEDFLG